MPAQENKAIIQRFYDEVWHQGNYDRFDEFVAPNVAHLRDHPDQGDYRGTIMAFRRDYPDIRYATRHLVAEGDCVVHHWTGRFTRSGKPVEFNGITLFRLEGGKIVERWPYAEPFEE
jgi:ketosteroid isomerase-like protein